MTTEDLISWLRDHCPYECVEAVATRIGQLTAERDAALEDAAIAKANGEHWSLAYSKWVKTDLSAKKLIEQDAEIVTLKSALREAKEALEYFLHPRVCQYSMPARNAIATINEVLND